MKNNIVHVVSFSGGRTSAYLVHLMEERRKKENLTVKYLFMDTGAEHPKTYEFIRKVVEHFGIDLVCLRTKFNPILGQKNDYKVISIDDICQDLKPWKEMTEKYGTPYNPGGAFCTRAMKTDIYEWYCNEHFGLKNYISWLGIRIDEPKRLKEEGERLSKKQARWYADLKYLADISDFEKQDILDWWKEQPFDLEIPEHLGNCVFCVKKGVNKVALAAKDEPEMAESFSAMLSNPEIRVVEKRKSPNEIMYRGNNSFGSVIALFKDIDRDELYYSLRGNKQEDSGNCSESCEIINGEEEIELPEEKPVEHFVNKTSTPESDKDSWQTPIELFRALENEFDFYVDVCASKDNALCSSYFTKEYSALDNDWSEFDYGPNTAYFLNPPYSKTALFLERSAQQAKTNRLIVVALVNANTDTKWFAKAVKTANEVRLLSGRIGFVRADGKKANGNTKGQCLIIWRGNCETPCQITMVDRDQLLADGDI